MTRPMTRPVAPTVMVAVMVVMLAGCGIRPTGIISAGGPPRADHSHVPNTIYLLRKGELVPVERAGLDGDVFLPFTQLSRGPTEAERRAGLTTQLREPVTVFLRARDLLEVHPGGPRTRAARAQIVCTAAHMRVVASLRVRFTRERRTFTCEDFLDLR